MLVSEHQAAFVLVDAFASWNSSTLRCLAVSIAADCLATQRRQVDRARVLSRQFGAFVGHWTALDVRARTLVLVVLGAVLARVVVRFVGAFCAKMDKKAN